MFLKEIIMNTKEVGQKLVELCQKGENVQAIDSLYSQDVVSIEASTGTDHPMAEIKGIDVVRKKTQEWGANNEVHSGEVQGPFPNGDRFAVIFKYEMTPKNGPMKGKRMTLHEVGIYTVKGGKIAKEEFFYDMG